MQPTSLGPNSQPFETPNGILAFALYLAGVPFSDADYWCRNEYTIELLRRLGFGDKGLPPIEAAKAAVAQGKKGELLFSFQRTGGIDELISLFQKEEAYLMTGDGEARSVFSTLLDSYKDGAISKPDAIIRLACVVLKMRIQFMNAWKILPPLIKFDNAGGLQTTANEGGSKTASHPGFKIISANASDKTKSEMGLM
jgi:hypothetical protein